MDRETAFVGCLALLALGLILIGCVGAGEWASRASCNAQWADFDHRYSFWTDCQVKVNGRWVPAKTLRADDL